MRRQGYTIHVADDFSALISGKHGSRFVNLVRPISDHSTFGIPLYFYGLILTMSVCLLMPCSVRAERLPIKTYTFAEGLSHNRVKRIVQDSHGFLWLRCFEHAPR